MPPHSTQKLGRLLLNSASPKLYRFFLDFYDSLTSGLCSAHHCHPPAATQPNPPSTGPENTAPLSEGLRSAVFLLSCYRAVWLPGRLTGVTERQLGFLYSNASSSCRFPKAPRGPGSKARGKGDCRVLWVPL